MFNGMCTDPSFFYFRVSLYQRLKSLLSLVGSTIFFHILGYFMISCFFNFVINVNLTQFFIFWKSDGFVCSFQSDHIK